MAKLLSGLLGPISGKLGNKVYYKRNGKQCVRSIPKKKSSGTDREEGKPPTHSRFPGTTGSYLAGVHFCCRKRGG